MYLIQITATGTPKNPKNAGKTLVYYQGRRGAWTDTPQELAGLEWKTEKGVNDAIAFYTPKFAHIDGFYGMWNHSLHPFKTE